MIIKSSSVARAVAVGAHLLAAPRVAHAQSVDYQRAEQLLTWNALRHVYGDQVVPTFYRDSTRFWYRVMTPRGAEFVRVSPTTGTRSLLFDNGRLAAALSLAADTAIAGNKLPFQTVAFDDDGLPLKVEPCGHCSIRPTCRKPPGKAGGTLGTISWPRTSRNVQSPSFGVYLSKKS